MSGQCVIALITARAGSKGLPGKNIRALGGKPLLAWSIRAALKACSIDEVYLTTDSQDYSEIGKKYGAKVPFLRPKELAEDNTGDLPVIKHFLEYYKTHKNVIPDYLIHLRPTTPLRDPAIIDKALDSIISDRTCSALRSVEVMSESAYKCFEIEERSLVRIFSNDQNIDNCNNGRHFYPQTYKANGYVDILKPSLILRDNLIHGNSVLAFQTEPVPEIDTEDDFQFACFKLENNPVIRTRLFS